MKTALVHATQIGHAVTVDASNLSSPENAALMVVAHAVFHLLNHKTSKKESN